MTSGFDLGSFASGVTGAVLGATATFGTGFLTRRETRRTARGVRIDTFIQRLEDLALAVGKIPHPVDKLSGEDVGRYVRALSAAGAIGFSRRSNEPAVLQWTLDYLGRITHPQARGAEISDLAVVASKLTEWSAGTTVSSWFAEHPAPAS